MEAILDKTIFAVIDPPNLRLTVPRWFQLPSPMTVFAFLLATYFIVCGGVVYDIINEPPSVGSYVDDRGISRPQAILPYRINGQYIMEGLVGSFMYCLGAVGFIILDNCNSPMTTKNNRLIMLGCGFFFVLLSYLTTRWFLRIKVPDYMER
uniref:Oligosaccharyltransferase complex subunit n=1 Tax=Panagrolaimus sp. JU765 TaxID=591449 RepID=A0AC34QAE4_9BILA